MTDKELQMLVDTHPEVLTKLSNRIKEVESYLKSKDYPPLTVPIEGTAVKFHWGYGVSVEVDEFFGWENQIEREPENGEKKRLMAYKDMYAGIESEGCKWVGSGKPLIEDTLRYRISIAECLHELEKVFDLKFKNLKDRVSAEAFNILEGLEFGRAEKTEGLPF